MTGLSANRADAIAALGDPVRRALHNLAVSHAITRDDAAAALGIARSTAASHLDRMAEAGLLTVEHKRLSGRSGPGAGRPSKLYRAAAAELVGSVPERHYELVAELMARAMDRSEREGVPVRSALDAEAFAAGTALAAADADLEGALDACGYEPEGDGEGGIRLANCPFHVLAQRHTQLVCAVNLQLVCGLTAGTGDPRTPVLAPHEGRCCVEIRAAAEQADATMPPDIPR